MIGSKLTSRVEEPPPAIMNYKEALSKILDDVEDSYKQLKDPHADFFYKREAPRILDALAVTLRGIFVKDVAFTLNYYPSDPFLPEHSDLVQKVMTHFENHAKRIKTRKKDRKGVIELSTQYVEHITYLIREQMPLTDKELDTFEYFIENL